MIKDGRTYLEGLRDGRIIYVGGERVDDVTTHPGFRNAARSYARIYDARSDERLRDVLTFEEAGERYATYFSNPGAATTCCGERVAVRLSPTSPTA